MLWFWHGAVAWLQIGLCSALRSSGFASLPAACIYSIMITLGSSTTSKANSTSGISYHTSQNSLCPRSSTIQPLPCPWYSPLVNPHLRRARSSKLVTWSIRSRRRWGEIRQNGLKSSFIMSQSSKITDCLDCAEANHFSNPVGGSKPFRLRYSCSAILRIVDYFRTRPSKLFCARTISSSIGCAEPDAGP